MISFFSTWDGFSFFFNFKKSKTLIFISEILIATSDLGSEVGFFIGQLGRRICFLDREPCFVIRRSTLFCVNRFKWDIILKWLMETLSINSNLNSEQSEFKKCMSKNRRSFSIMSENGRSFSITRRKDGHLPLWLKIDGHFPFWLKIDGHLPL